MITCPGTEGIHPEGCSGNVLSGPFRLLLFFGTSFCNSMPNQYLWCAVWLGQVAFPLWACFLTCTMEVSVCLGATNSLPPHSLMNKGYDETASRMGLCPQRAQTFLPPTDTLLHAGSGRLRQWAEAASLPRQRIRSGSSSFQSGNQGNGNVDVILETVQKIKHLQAI